jgi:hypothetical protein
MTRWQWLLRATVFSFVIASIAWLSSVIWAQTDLRYPCPCPGGCAPNYRYFGYFPTQWRRWPDGPGLEEINPRAVNSEVLQTPEGRLERSLPKAAPSSPQWQPPPQPPRPQPQMEPSLPLPSPPGGDLAVPAPEGELLPKGGLILPPEGTLIPPTPPQGEGSKPAPQKPSLEGELPGLPDEPTPPERPAPSNKGKTSDVVPAPLDMPKQAAARSSPGGVATVHRADAIGVATNPSANKIQPAGYATAESSVKPVVASEKRIPTVALGGFCPVELSRNARWVSGDLRWTVVHQGWIYRFSGAEQRRQFLANPDRFVPANSGNDVVMLVDKNRVVVGQVAHCALYNDRLYMFSGADTQAEFNKRPGRYAFGN